MGVFEEFRRAWRQAVENFWTELEDEPNVGAVYREVGRARTQLERLDAEIAATRQRAGEEREQTRVCERRQQLALDIGDAETARVAGEFASRHRERAEVLERKVDALLAERRLCRRDLEEMEHALQRGSAPADGHLDLDRHPAEEAFRGLEEADRRRSAEARLEELKRRMGQR